MKENPATQQEFQDENDICLKRQTERKLGIRTVKINRTEKLIAGDKYISQVKKYKENLIALYLPIISQSSSLIFIHAIPQHRSIKPDGHHLCSLFH